MSDKLSAWRALAEKEIKADPDKLIWHTPEGIDVKPVYTADDVAGIEAIDSMPGMEPFLRGPKRLTTNRQDKVSRGGACSLVRPTESDCDCDCKTAARSGNPIRPY